VPAEPTAIASAQSPALGIATLLTWLVTASFGAYMLGRLVASGGLRQQRAARGGLSPKVLFGHFSLAATGLAVWACYVATSWVDLSWVAIGLLIPAIGLGISTVTLWTPYPRPLSATNTGPRADPRQARPAGGAPGGPGDGVLARRVTDEMMARALTDDVLASQLIDQVIASVPANPALAARRRRPHAAALIPAGHGIGAVTTFALAVVTAAGGIR
jgi:hypothetical protein